MYLLTSRPHNRECYWPQHAPPGGGGVWGRGTLYVLHIRIRYVLRERPPFSKLHFRSGAYNFHTQNDNNISFQSISMFSWKSDFTFFAVPDTIVFKLSFRSSVHRRPAPAASQSASQTRPSMGNACTFSQYEYLVPETPLIPRKSIPVLVLDTPIFTLEPAPEPPPPPPPPPPHFQFASELSLGYQNGGECLFFIILSIA